MTVLVPRNTTIPTEKKDIFSTADDNQPRLRFMFCRERREARHNWTLGRFHLEDHARSAWCAEDRGVV